jgi:hypothetical protein
MEHFANETYTEPESGTVLHAGDVVRMKSWGGFADATILGFDGNGNARVARPYLYASGVGTTCPTSLVGVEMWNIPCAHVIDHYTVMENDGRYKL